MNCTSQSNVLPPQNENKNHHELNQVLRFDQKLTIIRPLIFPLSEEDANTLCQNLDI